ncbi:MAG TPA: hypothetical protein PK104_04365 [Spirochaetota bacterium]|nr:hypothetical protein [Spirochaetota bacterium]
MNRAFHVRYSEPFPVSFIIVVAILARVNMLKNVAITRRLFALVIC